MRRRPALERGARGAACAILDKVEAGRGHSNTLLAALPDEMDERERALATALVYGVLRRRNALDRLLRRAARRRLKDIDAAILTVLRVAAFQLLYLSRVPAAAAVNEAVAMIRARAGRGAAAFANGVLRAACRAIEAGLPAPAPRPDPQRQPEAYGEYLAETHSFPRFLVDRFVGRYGPESGEALLEAMNRPAPLALRVAGGGAEREASRRRLEEEGVPTVASAWLEGAARVVKGVPQRAPSFRTGSFYIQDEASQLVARLLEPLGPGDALLDLCAAPGGKILAALERRPPGARHAVAADLSLSRLTDLKRNALRGGVRDVLCVVMDAARPALRARFERVMLDAPCSGTGIIRRHPEIRWRRSEEDIRRFARLQHDLLLQACDLLAPGGRLVYAVCSIEPEEGPERVAALLAARPGIEPIDARPLLPPRARSLVDESGHLVTLPHRDDMDGFFAAVLARRGGP